MAQISDDEVRGLVDNMKQCIGQEERSVALQEAREIAERMTESGAWDTIQARDVDPRIIEYVTQQLAKGIEPRHVCHRLGLSTHTKGWRKIIAALRSGFRPAGDVYVYQELIKLKRVINRSAATLEDAFENGTPMLVTVPGTKTEPGYVEERRVKGATKELAAMIKVHLEAVQKPLDLMKQIGGIGESKEKGNKGLTILVQNNIPMPSEEEVKAHQEEIKAKAQAIEVQSKPVK